MRRFDEDWNAVNAPYQFRFLIKKLVKFDEKRKEGLDMGLFKFFLNLSKRFI